MTNKEDIRIKRLVTAESKRLITKIFKHSLTVLEDLRYQHIETVEKLDKLTDKERESLNYLDFTRYSLLRKRILDNGNEGVRDLENFLDNFAFSLKNKDNNNISYSKKE
jgi:hypothetical protein